MIQVNDILDRIEKDLHFCHLNKLYQSSVKKMTKTIGQCVHDVLPYESNDDSSDYWNPKYPKFDAMIMYEIFDVVTLRTLLSLACVLSFSY